MHAADNGIGDDGARALAISLEKNTTLVTLHLGGARLCVLGGWGGGRCGALPRPEAAARGRARTMQSEARASAVGPGARVRPSGPVAGRVWLLLVGA